MAYLAELARAQGSSESEYTDVHGVCDITHTEELFHALAAEMALDPPQPSTDLYEGVDLLRALIKSIVDPVRAKEVRSSAMSGRRWNVAPSERP
jgi:hypothetical protein